MLPVYDSGARKRAVNLTLNEDLVNRAKFFAHNLSGVVEELLAEYVAREDRERMEKLNLVKTTVAVWNKFSSEHGSFSDDHSTL
jgi:antitoxin CcdA